MAKIAGTSVDGDRSLTTVPLEASNRSSNQSAAETARLQRSAVPATTAGTATSSPQSGRRTPLPKRPYNPLSKFASYTYNLALYMMTPEAYIAFVRGGKRSVRDLNGVDLNGVYLIAQSGGINNNVSMRPPGMTMDYFIDNLKMKTFLTGQGSTDATNSITYTFTITETTGFSFVQKLANATRSLMQQSRLAGVGGTGADNAMRQHYVLGIGFRGYNADGSVALATDIFDQDTYVLNDGGPLYERYFDIVMNKLTFNLDGGNTVYNIEAAAAGQSIAFGNKNGVILDRGVARGITVEDALTGPNGIITQLNQQQQQLYKSKKLMVPYVYDVKWVNDKNSDKIKNARLITKEDFSTLYKTKINQVPFSAASTNISAVNDATAVNTTPGGPPIKELKFEPNTSIGSIIKKIIGTSTYLADALAAVNKSKLEVESRENRSGTDSVENEGAEVIRWYSITSQIEPLEFDPTRNDYAYRITYIISPYETPTTTSIYAGKTTDYYGPHKRYEYWFTGLNTEIIKYSQTLNNMYYEAEGRITRDVLEGRLPSPLGPSKNPGQRVPGDRTATLGDGYDAQNSYINSLYAPGDWVKSKIEILGDPDYLMSDVPGSLNEVYSPFYKDQTSFTINPNGGQVFIEINFFENQDYNYSDNGDYTTDGVNRDDGLMTINRSLMLWDYPKAVKDLGVQGISYLVKVVESVFSRGRFTQNLELSINTFPNINPDTEPFVGPPERPSDQDPRARGLNRLQENNIAAIGLNLESSSATDLRARGLNRQPDIPAYQNDPNTGGLLLGRPLSVYGGRRQRPLPTQPTVRGVADDDGLADARYNQEVRLNPAIQNSREGTVLGRPLTALGGRRPVRPRPQPFRSGGGGAGGSFDNPIISPEGN